MSAQAVEPAAPGPARSAAVVRPPTRAELAWYHFAWSVMFPPCWLMWRAKVIGRENLPQTVPYILAPVHRSYVDTLLAAYVTNRRLRFMAKEEIFSKAWSARLFGSLVGFPVRRGTPDREALLMCERAFAAVEAYSDPRGILPQSDRPGGPRPDSPGMPGEGNFTS